MQRNVWCVACSVWSICLVLSTREQGAGWEAARRKVGAEARREGRHAHCTQQHPGRESCPASNNQGVTISVDVNFLFPLRNSGSASLRRATRPRSRRSPILRVYASTPGDPDRVSNPSHVKFHLTGIFEGHYRLMRDHRVGPGPVLEAWKERRLPLRLA